MTSHIVDHHFAKPAPKPSCQLPIEGPPKGTETQQRIKSITLAIKQADRQLRERFPLLGHQSAIGAACFFAAAGAFLVCSGLFLAGVLPWWVCILVNAVCVSVLREIEHDLVHDLYFKDRPRLQNLMMAGVWPFLGNMVSPWYRRAMHLLHHRSSGHDDDFEEQLIGNGLPLGIFKILAMFDTGLSMLFRQKELEKIPFYHRGRFLAACLPVVFVFYGIWWSFLAFHLVELTFRLAGAPLMLPDWLSAAVAVLNAAAVVYALPNVLQKISLQVLSSNMHYFGDVSNRLQETQVLTAWYLLPFQLFSFNFGSTHAIHHFVVNQPFYLRQMVARKAHAAMRENGVRFNDLATLWRANRYDG